MEPRRSKMDPDRNHRRRRPRRRRAERQPRRAERGAGLQHETTLTNETAPPPSHPGRRSSGSDDRDNTAIGAEDTFGRENRALDRVSQNETEMKINISVEK